MAGNVVYLATQFGLVIVTARAGSAEMVGQLALALAITAPLFLFANLRLRTVLGTDVHGRHAFSDYVWVRIWTTIGVIATSAVVAAMEHRWVILLVGCAKAVESGGDLLYGLMQRKERMDLIAISMMARGLLGLAAFAIATWLTGSVAKGALAMGVCWAIVLIAFDWPRSRPLIDWKAAGGESWRLVAATVPLGLAATVSSLFVNVPRYWIKDALGDHALGVFAAVTAPGLAAIPLIAALGEAASPRLAVELALGRTRMLGGLLLIGGAVGALAVGGAAMAGGPILRVLYGSGYGEFGWLLVLIALVCAAGSIASVLSYAVIAVRYFRTYFVLVTAATAVAAAGCLLHLGPGLEGPALAMLLGMAVQALGGALVISYAVWRVTKTSPHGH